MLTAERVENAIREINAELSTFKIRPENLVKFGNLPPDREFLGYVNGTGGAYVKFLALLVRKLNLANIVELGNREGLSTLAIYDGLDAQGTLTTIDLVKDQRYCPGRMWNDERVKFVFGDACDLSILGDRIPLDIDLLFSDTVHFYSQIRDEFQVYQHLLADTALIAVDDINLNDKRKFFDETPLLKWDLTELCYVSGWGLILFRRDSKQSPEARLAKAYKASAEIWKRKYDEKERIISELERRKLENRLKEFLGRHKHVYALVKKARSLFKV